MWSGKDKIWSRYNKDILAADSDAALYLRQYLRKVRTKRLYIATIEVIDLQRYKVYKSSVKVKRCLNERLDIPFVFAHYKN